MSKTPRSGRSFGDSKGKSFDDDIEEDIEEDLSVGEDFLKSDNSGVSFMCLGHVCVTYVILIGRSDVINIYWYKKKYSTHFRWMT